MRRSVRYELARLTGGPSTGVLAVAAVLLSVLLSWAFGALVDDVVGLGPSPSGREVLAATLAQSPVTGICVGAIGVLSLGQEYRHATLHTTLLVQPRRRTAFAAKAVVVAIVAGVVAVVSGTGSVLAVARVTSADVAFGVLVAIGAVHLVTIVGWALVGLAAVALTGRQAFGLGLLLVWPLLVEPSLRAALLSSGAAPDALAGLLPFSAPVSAMSSVAMAEGLLLEPVGTPWSVSVAVFAGFVALALWCGFRAFEHRGA